MSEARHTPGPWIDPHNSDWNYGLEDDENWYAGIRDEDGNSIAIASHPDREVMHANARLISKAPELVQALADLFMHCEMIHKHWGEGCNAREAKAAREAARALLDELNHVVSA